MKNVVGDEDYFFDFFIQTGRDKSFEEFMQDENLVQQSWIQLVKSRITNPQCAWYGKDVEEVVAAFKQVSLKRGWNFQSLLENIKEYQMYNKQKS